MRTLSRSYDRALNSAAVSRSRRRLRAAVEALEMRLVLSTIVVNTFVDQSDPPGASTISLRDAIADAEAKRGPSTIDLPAGTYPLTRGQLVISDAVGPLRIGAIGGAAVIDAQSASRVFLVGRGAVTISGLTVTGGNAEVGGGIDNRGQMTVIDSTVTGNDAPDAGAISNSGRMSVVDSTISDNTVTTAGDGAIANSGRFTLVNSTVTGNSSNDGSSIYNIAAMTIRDSTVSGSNGDGIYNGRHARVTLANTIVAGNTGSGNTGGDVSGAIISRGYNLIGDASGSSGWIKTDRLGSAAHPLDPGLSPLGNYGGPTQTQIPLPGSPAITAGSVGRIPAHIATDQRGFPRVVDQTVDIGAVELQRGAGLDLTPPPLQSVTAGTAATVALGSFTHTAGVGPFAVIVNWGDGSPENSYPLPQSGSLGVQSHTFMKPGLLAGSIVVVDSGGDLSNFATLSIKSSGAGKTITVNTTADSKDPADGSTVSLRDAVDRADASLVATTIDFDPTVFATPQTITLDSNLVVKHNPASISIDGPAGGLTIAGPGVVVDGGVSANISEVIAANNIGYSASAIDNSGKVTITDCTVAGIQNSGQATIDGTTVTGDFEGVENSGRMDITDSTITGNGGVHSPYNDSPIGGVSNQGTLTIADSTITDSIDSADIENYGTLTLSNSIVGTVADVGGVGTIHSLGHNFVGNTNGVSGWQLSDVTGTVANPLNPDLSPLGDYGGPTQTQMPLPGSPVIGAASVALVPAGVTTDQRGSPRVVDGRVDIGAFQLTYAPITIQPPSTQSFIGGSAVSVKLGSFSDPGGNGPFAVTVCWGDGSADTTYSLDAAGSLGSQTHSFINAGSLEASIAIADRSGGVAPNAQLPVSVTVAPAKVIMVNTTADQTDPAGSKTVSLRDAVSLADASVGPVTIMFDPSIFAIPQTITVGSELDFSGNHFGPINLIGPAAGVAISCQTIYCAAGITSNISQLTFTGANFRLSNDGVMALQDSTITGTGGPEFDGGIYNLGDMTVVNCTIVGNISDGGSGGIYNTGQMSIADSTITGNGAKDGAGGIVSVLGASLTIGNSIVAGNMGGDITEDVKSLGHNFIGAIEPGSSGWLKSDLIGTHSHPLNPMLSPLGNNGGPTQTEIPLPGSPVIGAGSVALIPPGVTTDQRGLPRVVGGEVDIGAVEVQPAPS